MPCLFDQALAYWAWPTSADWRPAPAAAPTPSVHCARLASCLSAGPSSVQRKRPRRLAVWGRRQAVPHTSRISKKASSIEEQDGRVWWSRVMAAGDGGARWRRMWRRLYALVRLHARNSTRRRGDYSKPLSAPSHTPHSPPLHASTPPTHTHTSNHLSTDPLSHHNAQPLPTQMTFPPACRSWPPPPLARLRRSRPAQHPLERSTQRLLRNL